MRLPLIPLNQANENCMFYELERRTAIVHPGEEPVGMIITSMIGEVMSHEFTINSDKKIVTRLVRIFKKCEQVSCISEAALRSDKFERAKDILCLLGRTMWVIIQERILEYEIIHKKHPDCWDMDHEYQTAIYFEQT